MKKTAFVTYNTNVSTLNNRRIPKLRGDVCYRGEIRLDCLDTTYYEVTLTDTHNPNYYVTTFMQGFKEYSLQAEKRLVLVKE